MQMTVHSIQRRSDGSIDIEFYRERGLADRRMLIARSLRGARKLGLPVLLASILVLGLRAPHPRAASSENQVPGFVRSADVAQR